MTDCWVAPEYLFNGQDIVCGQAVRIVDGRITEIAKHRTQRCGSKVI